MFKKLTVSDVSILEEGIFEILEKNGINIDVLNIKIKNCGNSVIITECESDDF